MSKHKTSKYEESKSLSEAEIVAAIKAEAGKREQAIATLNAHKQKAGEAEVVAVRASGALDALVELAKSLSIDLAKHFPPSPSQGAPPVGDGGGDSSSSDEAKAGEGDGDAAPAPSAPALSVVE